MIIAGSNSSQRIFSGQRKDFIVMRKDTFKYTGTYEYVHTSGIVVPYDFTDCIGMMHIKKKKTDLNPLRVIGITFDEYEYSLTGDAESMDLDAGKYYYDLQIYDANGEMVTKLYGTFVVLQDVTDFKEIVDLYPSFDIQSEIKYTFDDFKSSVNALQLKSELGYTLDDFKVSTVKILPVTEITYRAIQFIVAFNLVNIKSEISYTFNDFIYFPMRIFLGSEITYLDQYTLTMDVSIYSEITYTLELFD